MKRQDVIRGISAIGAGAALSTVFNLKSQAQSPPRKANILFLMVDELRFPMHLPPGITDERRFVQTYMPNLWRIWQKSVSFTNHHTAATACSPARSCLFTGLYAHQHFQLITLAPNPQAPGTGLGIGLATDYPNLGRSLRELGYQTWYFGKWHMSFAGLHPVLTQSGASPASIVNFQGADYLDDYGYNGGSFPDPEGGGPLTGEEADPQIVSGFITWARNVRPRLQAPWCTVVSLVNPHDVQFWWDGVIDDPTRTTQKDGTGAEVSPNPALSIPTVYNTPPPNWEARPLTGEPEIITNYANAQNTINGAISNSSSNPDFTTAPISPPIPTTNAPTSYTIAPFNYAAKCLDYYLYLMRKVDGEIGKVLREIEGTDTIVVFTSDHGEYASSHGLRGKGVSAYRESTQVPLLVYDPLGQYTAAPDSPRQGLTSSIDIFPMVMTIANQGNSSWLQNSTYKTLYSGRHNLYGMLRNANAAGRSYILHTCDESIPNGNPQYHVIGYRTNTELLTTYATWNEQSGQIDFAGLRSQYFDFRNGNRLELVDTAGSNASQQALTNLQGLISSELRKPMTSSLETVKQRMIADRYRYLTSQLYQSLPQRVFDAVNW